MHSNRERLLHLHVNAIGSARLADPEMVEGAGERGDSLGSHLFQHALKAGMEEIVGQLTVTGVIMNQAGNGEPEMKPVLLLYEIDQLNRRFQT